MFVVQPCQWNGGSLELVGGTIVGVNNMSTPYTESNVYKVTRRNYRLRKAVGPRILPPGEYKREYHGVCEVCGRTIPSEKHKAYHHWDDDLIAMGIWVCYKCHKIIEGVDAGMADTYLIKKAEIEKEYALKRIQELGIRV